MWKQAVVLGVVMLTINSGSLWLYHHYFAAKTAIVDLDSVLKQHVQHYGSLGFDQKQSSLIAQTFGRVMETSLQDFKGNGYLILVKQAVVEGNYADLTSELNSRIESQVAPLVDQIRKEGH